jgi:hypothetical protein
VPGVLQSGEDVAAAARAGSVSDFYALAEAASAGVYGFVGDPLNAVAEDVRAMAAVLRVAARRGAILLEEGFEEEGEAVANGLEDALDTCVAEVATGGPTWGEGSGGRGLAALRAALVQDQVVSDVGHVQWTVAEHLSQPLARRAACFCGAQADAASTQQLLMFEAIAQSLASSDWRCAPPSHRSLHVCSSALLQMSRLACCLAPSCFAAEGMLSW